MKKQRKVDHILLVSVDENVSQVNTFGDVSSDCYGGTGMQSLILIFLYVFSL